ncbi:MAG: hypothetical protein WB780_09080 [Candidatus Acidiferrales bacterium]
MTIEPGSGEKPDLSERSQDALAARLSAGRKNKYARFAIAALGAIPWVGGFIAASASLSAEREQQGVNDLQRMWLEEHKEKIKELNETLADIFVRLDNFGDDVQQRIESPEYLALVRTAFRSWDSADTEDKRQMFKKLITNAGAIKLCSDDLIRLFLHWIELYHETHFVVIREIYRHPNITRGQLWDSFDRPRPREDSSDADLFRYLIRDLSTGGVIRQARDTDGYGQFLRKDMRGQSHQNPSRVMESAFEDTKPYVLTELGKKFVHYVMEDVVSQIGSGGPS